MADERAPTIDEMIKSGVIDELPDRPDDVDMTAAAAKALAITRGAKITIPEICDALMNEASRINTAQRALVDCGWRSRFSDREKRRELLFVAAADMLWRLEPYQEEIKRMMSADKPKKKSK